MALLRFEPGFYGVRDQNVSLMKLHGLSPRANYTDRATAAYRRSDANFCG
jgi:hypothetical protein